MPEKKRLGQARVKTRTYSVHYVPDKEAGGYTAHVPALGIVTEGETLRQARIMAQDAISGRLAVLRELNQPLPRDVQAEQLEVEV
jgi:predicted RNase H-like HicB family nuclease